MLFLYYSPVVSGQFTQLVGPGPVCSSDMVTHQCPRSGRRNFIYIGVSGQHVEKVLEEILDPLTKLQPC